VTTPSNPHGRQSHAGPEIRPTWRRPRATLAKRKPPDQKQVVTHRTTQPSPATHRRLRDRWQFSWSSAALIDEVVCGSWAVARDGSAATVAVVDFVTRADELAAAAGVKARLAQDINKAVPAAMPPAPLSNPVFTTQPLQWARAEMTPRNKHPDETIRQFGIGCGAAKHIISFLRGNRRACVQQAALVPRPRPQPV
jgi:hypothetical protein